MIASKSLLSGSTVGFILAVINSTIDIFSISIVEGFFSVFIITIFAILGGLGAYYVTKSCEKCSLLEATVPGDLSGYAGVLVYFVVEKTFDDIFNGHLPNESTLGIITETVGASVACVYFIYESSKRNPKIQSQTDFCRF